MSASLHQPWTQDRFFAWAERQEERYEFDGAGPVAMTGGTLGHSLLVNAIGSVLRGRLRDGPCRVLGPDAGIATAGSGVRYPDAVVTCAPFDLSVRLVPSPVIVFQVLSPTSGRTDRIVKIREYAAVPSILRYVIAESTAVGLTVLSRATGVDPWTATALTEEDVLALPEIGVEVPVPEIYEGLDFPD